MMTFNINRPLYSFGLGVGSVLLVTGLLACSIPVEDSRDFLVANERDLSVTDMRIQDVYEGRIMRVEHVREFKVFDDRVILVTSEREFIIENDRTILVKRCDDEKS